MPFFAGHRQCGNTTDSHHADDYPQHHLSTTGGLSDLRIDRCIRASSIVRLVGIIDRLFGLDAHQHHIRHIVQTGLAVQ